MGAFIFYDLRRGLGSRDIALLFPAWRGAAERLLVLSPHDDDALLGAGYAIAAALEQGAQVNVAIFCDGSAGYSRPEDKETIVATRRRETINAFQVLGLEQERIFYLGYPDFSLVSYIGWKLSSGREGTLRPVISLMRRLGITRLLIPNGYREHLDHEAAYDIGRYDGVQAGDPVGADWGAPTPVRNVLQYAVWGDFAPEDVLLAGGDPRIRANRAIVAPYAVEEKIALALKEWRSQGQIIEGLLAARRERDCGIGMMELYMALDPRPKLDYGPYRPLLRALPVQG